MAIDTAHKRFSMLTFGDATPNVLPPPSGSITAADQRSLIGLYSGIAPDAPSAATSAARGGLFAAPGKLMNR